MTAASPPAHGAPVLDRRPIGRVLRAAGDARHYRALANMLRVYPNPAAALARYLAGAGRYPTRLAVRTPAGVVRPRLYSWHDMLTVNEVFCRLDYELGGPARAVVDVGSNIGISALYFLTRPSRPFCYLYEPDPRNLVRLRDNLADFGGRWELAEAAVGPAGGRVRFGTEPTGRYGRVGADPGQASIEVDCVAINDVLERAVSRFGAVDLLKLDIEGLEVDTVLAIDRALLRRVRAVALEAEPGRPLHPDLFAQRQYGCVCRLTARGG